MKKEFLNVLALILTCFPLTIYSMGQVEKEIQLGRALFSCKTDNPQLLQKLLSQQNTDQSRLIVPSPENQDEIALQIGTDGELYVGNIKQFIVKDPDGNVKVTADTMIKSLDEQNIKEKAEKLCAGDNITAFFANDNAKITITFDQRIKLVSTTDQSEHSALLSQLTGSQLITGAMAHHYQEKNDNKIELQSTGQEIQTLLAFLTANEDGRKKLINELPIIEHIKLITELDYHSPKALFADCRNNLIVKIFNALKESNLNWFQELHSLPEGDHKLRLQAVAGNILNEVITPIPKVLFTHEKISDVTVSNDGTIAIIGYFSNTEELTWKIINLVNRKVILKKSTMKDNVKELRFAEDETKIIIKGQDNTINIIDLVTQKSIFEKKGVYKIQTTGDGTKAIVQYDWNWETINLEIDNIIFEENDVDIQEITVTQDSTKAIVIYEDNKMKIINLEIGNIIFEENDVDIQEITVTQDSTKAIVIYEDNKMKIINLEIGNIIFEENDVVIQGIIVTQDSTKAIIIYEGNKMKIINLNAKKTILQKSNIFSASIPPNSIKAAVISNDNKMEIIDLITENIIVTKNNVNEARFINETKILIEYKDKTEILDLVTENIIKIIEAKVIDIWPDKTKATVLYRDNAGTGEVIDLSTETIIFTRSNIQTMKCSPDGTKVVVKYCDNRVEIINLETGNKFFATNNIFMIMFMDCTKAIVSYKNKTMEVLDLADYDRGIHFATFTPEQLLFVFNLKQSDDPSEINEYKAKQIWQSFDPAIQKILKKEYFSNKQYSILEEPCFICMDSGANDTLLRNIACPSGGIHPVNVHQQCKETAEKIRPGRCSFCNAQAQ